MKGEPLMDTHVTEEPSIAERLAGWLSELDTKQIPAASAKRAQRLVLDVLGWAVAARNEDYVRAVLGATDGGKVSGTATAFGHRGGFSAFDAALINGTAAHGEDYDDTFEGGPIHSGAVI